MVKWIASLVASSFTFALADVLCDICISESEADSRTVETAAEGEDEGEGIEMSTGDMEVPQDHAMEGYISDSAHSNSGLLLRNHDRAPSYKKLTSRTGDMASQQDEEDDLQLSGAQDAAIAGIVTIVGLVFSLIYWLCMSPPAVDAFANARKSNGITLRWGPTTHFQFWLAMLGGAVAFLHYFFLLKAFEGAPSTVLLPLVQVASVSVLLGSSVVALYRNEPWITPTHAVAYSCMFIGGVLPACAGQLSMLLSRAFWGQTFVTFAILAEFSLGLHDLMLSGCSYSSEHQNVVARRDDEETTESTEFFIWSRLSFIATFLGMYLINPKLRRQLIDLFSGRIPTKYVALSAFSEGLTILGFYFASIAYGLFYQAGIVHAAEASLSQLLNLMLAYLLLKGFGVGRASAVGSLPAKLASFLLVTCGLFLCTSGDGNPHFSSPPAPPTMGLPLAAGLPAVTTAR